MFTSDLLGGPEKGRLVTDGFVRVRRRGPQRLRRDVPPVGAGADLARSLAGGSPGGVWLLGSGGSGPGVSVCVAADVSGGSQSLSDWVAWSTLRISMLA
ncbi:dna replication licensing factor [Lasius niger]|uniref:Dna replication licensing factor n=2 Tax=Lasius niger TaxID=67767 RepID=A0A0J7KMN1_LASNI|nr:dna replication licensing factor [Lasius niger]